MFSELAVSLPDLRFMWVGYGQESDLPKAANVTLTGLVGRAEAIAKIAELDIYVQTSSWEGMSIAVLEAMAMGKVVIATNIIGNRDVVEHGVTGFLGDSAEDFVRLIRMLVDDGEMRARIGRAAAEYIREHHDLDLAVKRYSRLYFSR